MSFQEHCPFAGFPPGSECDTSYLAPSSWSVEVHCVAFELACNELEDASLLASVTAAVLTTVCSEASAAALYCKNVALSEVHVKMYVGERNDFQTGGLLLMD